MQGISTVMVFTRLDLFERVMPPEFALSEQPIEVFNWMESQNQKNFDSTRSYVTYKALP
jgi:hypothetical protein